MRFTGRLLLVGSTTATAYLYTGEQWDVEVGAYYLRARWYLPEWGRFLSRDTYEGEEDDPISQNRFLYVNGNPVHYVDPSGHSTKAARQGQIVHKAIAEDFRRKLPALGVSGPGVVKLLERTGLKLDVVARLFPDLTIMPPTKAMFEIKPAGIGQIAFGFAQLKGYIDIMNEFDPTKGWHAGTALEYTPPLTIGIDPLHFAVVARPVSGVIVYKVFSVAKYAKRMAMKSAASQNAELQQRTGLATMLSSMLGF